MQLGCLESIGDFPLDFFFPKRSLEYTLSLIFIDSSVVSVELCRHSFSILPSQRPCLHQTIRVLSAQSRSPFMMKVVVVVVVSHPKHG